MPSQDVEPTTYLVISYFPLLRGQATLYPPGDIESVINSIRAAGSPSVLGCIWSADENDIPAPVLVIPQMDEVFDHLFEWSEGVPQERFDLYIRYSTLHDRYVVALHPNIPKSIGRFRELMKREGKEVVWGAHFKIVYQDLHFISQPHPATFLSLRSQVPLKVAVGMLDARDFTPESSPASWDPSKVRFIGKFTVHDDDAIDYLFEEAKDSP